MGELTKSEAQQLREIQLKESLRIGMMFLSRRGEEIVRITEIFDQQYRAGAHAITQYRYERITDLIDGL